MTPQEEREIATRYSGGFAWPTVLLALFLLASTSAVTAAGFAGSIPLWVGALVNSWLAYMWYTIHHDATHELICGRRKKLLWLNNALGHMAGVPLHLSFTHYSKSHLLHHAHTNNPEKDPDYMSTTGPLRQVPIRSVIMQVIKYLSLLPFIENYADRVLPKKFAMGVKMMRSRKGLFNYHRICFLVLVAAIIAGQGQEVFMLFTLPSIGGMMILSIWFQWLPHQPNVFTDRYRNTRVFTWAFSHIMLLAQDHHLIHHLYPRLPFYRYRTVYRQIRPSLVANGAHLDGRAATV